MKEQSSDIVLDPLVSVIVPCYNYGHFLADTLKCVDMQSYPNIECIVVDDGSTDNTRRVAESFAKSDKRFIYVYQENQGLSTARNTGIQHSKGTFIQFLDADDLLHSEKIETQLRFLQNNGETNVVFSDYRYFEGIDLERVQRLLLQNLNKNSYESIFIPANEAIERMTKCTIAVVNAPLVPRSQIDATGLFETSYRSLEDWNYWFRMAKSGTTFIEVKYSIPLAFVRRHGTSMSRQAGIMLNAHSKLVSDMKRYSGDAHLRYMIDLNERLFRGSVVFEEIQYHDLRRGLSLAISSAFRSPRNFFWYMRNSLFSIKMRAKKR